MKGQKSSEGKPSPRNDPSQSARAEETPLSPTFTFPPLSPSSDSLSSEGLGEPSRTLSDDTPTRTESEGEKTVSAFPLHTPMTTTPMPASNSRRTTDNLPEQEVSMVSKNNLDMPAMLMKVIPSSEFVDQESNIVTSSSPVDGPSKNTSLHAHFGSDLDITPSAESTSANLPEASDRNVLLYPQLSQTRNPFVISINLEEMEAASQQKPRASEHDTPTTHAVRSTTIPSGLPPQPTHPEEVFSEPNPFSQVYPPRQRCESRSCSMRRSAFNAMSCNMISNTTSPSPTSDSDPPSPAPYPTEPVLVEMTSEDQNSSLQSDCFLNVSAWNEQSTLPTTTTPSGQSNNSEDIISCFESSDALRNPPPAASKVEATPEQDPTAKSDAPSHQSASDEVLLALLSPLPVDCNASTSEEEDAAPNLNFYAPSSDSEAINPPASPRTQTQSLKEDEVTQAKEGGGPERDGQKVTNSTSDSTPGPSAAPGTETQVGQQPVEDPGGSKESPAPVIDVSKNFVASLVLSVPPSLNQIAERQKSRTQPPSRGRRSTSSESSNLQSSSENTDNEQTSINEHARGHSRSEQKTDPNRGTNNSPKP